MHMAHRGGAALFPENTLYAFTEVVKKYKVDVLEIDVWASKDGYPVILHDETVDRTTNGQGKIHQLTLAQIKKLDAAYHFTRDGKTYPLRGKGITIPTLEELFQALPQIRINIEIQQVKPPIEKTIYDLILKYHMTEKVLIAAKEENLRKRFAAINQSSIATSASVWQAVLFYLLNRVRLNPLYTPTTDAFQVPLRRNGLTVITPRFIEAAHRKNIFVHAWTINEKQAMRKLIEMGIDGIITDYPDRLDEVLAEMG